MTESALLTDSYHLSMVQAYLEHGMDEEAVFEFFVRKLPEGRNFLVAAGLEQVLDYLEELSFTSEEIAWLKSTGRYGPGLLGFLERFRFSGEVWAMEEGTPFFASEPILRVKAPIAQAQLIETRVINILHFQTIVASKAARSRLVAPGKQLVDFGLRRAHGAEAGLLAARASFVAGFDGTSTLLAGRRFGIPIFGTMAHSFIEAQVDPRVRSDALGDGEFRAFLDFARSNPDNAIFLIDTYDTEAGARKAVSAARNLRDAGIDLKGVRLDSGNLEAHSRNVREILDQGGLRSVRIFVSGNIDEFVIRDLLAREAPIDGFGVGTNLTTSGDSPSLDCAYKLEEYAGIPRLKRSEGKATFPGPKQVFRSYDESGGPSSDILSLEGEQREGEPLLMRVMTDGKRLPPSRPLREIRSACLSELQRLPRSLKSIVNVRDYPVRLSPGLRTLVKKTA